MDGLVWPTSEHAYQGSKFEDPVMRERVRAAKTPREAQLLEAQLLAQLSHHGRACAARARRLASRRKDHGDG